MGTTLTAINEQLGVELRTVVAVEGIQWLLTDGSTTAEVNAAATAWSGTDWLAARGGLSVSYDLSQSLSPWEPFSASSQRVTLTVMDVDGSDTIGAMLGKRDASIRTVLAEDLTPTEAAITVKRADDFSGDVICIGCETIAPGSVDTGTDTFSSCLRGLYSPFEIEGGGGFGRTHYATPVMPGVDLESTSSTQVTEEPIEFRGRWVGVWLHRVIDGVLDVKAQAHCVFAGKIAEVSDSEDGKTVIHCMGVLDVLKETMILRQQWRAKLKEGIWVRAGARFQAADTRDGTSKHADDLVVKPSGASGAYQMDEGFYGGYALETKINAWLTQARTDSDLNFKLVFSYSAADSGGTLHSILDMSDPTAGNVQRRWAIGCTDPLPRIFYGWGAEQSLSGHTNATTGRAFSDYTPLRMYPWDNGSGQETTLHVEKVVGSFVDQTDFMPPAVASSVGVLRVGDSFFPCASPSIAAGDGTVVIGAPINSLLGAENLPARTLPDLPLSITDSGDIEVVQVLCLESSFGVLVLSMLASTGGSNWPAYELLPEQTAAALPFDLISNLEDDIANAPWSADRMRVVVDEPTRLTDLWNVSFILRHVQFVWRQGGIRLKGFATPTSAATLTVGTDDRAAALNVKDAQRAITRQSDEWLRNVLTIKSGATAGGEDYTSTTTIEIPGSVSNHGGRPITLSARNAVKGAGSSGEDVGALLPTFIAPLAFLSYPATLITIPIHYGLFEQATPGEVCLLSDGFARDPSTGLRGLTSKPALVVGQRIHGWGGTSGPATGEADFMLFPRLSLAPYSPCAQVASYDAGTKVLTCEAHEHSEASAAADASYFVATSAVTVMQIDPDTAGSPLAWDDVIASKSGNDLTLTTGLAGYDAALKYRVYSRGYANATTNQRSNVYQADDADGLVADLRQPYGLTFNATGQVQTFTASVATSLAERPPTAAYGDGVPLDTGHARAIARSLNNAIGYLTAPHMPSLMTEMSYGGSGTRRLVYAAPVFLGVGTVSNELTRKLYVGPWIKSASGSITCRVTLTPTMPASADPTAFSRDDIVRQLPYVSHDFTTSSSTYAIASPVGLDISHCILAPGVLGGWAWLLVELTNNGRFRGFGTCYVGPLEAP